MHKKELRNWKKVFIDDLKYIVIEIKDLVEQPAMIFLEGDLGAGKTSFAKSFLDDETLSPTYSIITEAKGSMHADFYRIEDRSELDHLELELYLENKQFALVEWGLKYSNYITSHVPDDFSFYELKITEDLKEGKDFRHYKLFEINFL